MFDVLQILGRVRILAPVEPVSLMSNIVYEVRENCTWASRLWEYKQYPMQEMGKVSRNTFYTYSATKHTLESTTTWYCEQCPTTYRYCLIFDTYMTLR